MHDCQMLNRLGARFTEPRKTRIVALAAAVAWMLGGASTASAAAFAAAEFAGESGTVVSSNPTGLFFNPAAIAYPDGTSVFASGVLALRGGTWTHKQTAEELADDRGPLTANSGTAHFQNVFGAPALFATMKLKNFSLGAGIYAPFAGRVRWSSNPVFANDPDYPLAAGGVQRWAITEGAMTHLFFTLGAAARFGRLALGVGFNLILSSLSNTQAKNLSGSGVPNSANEGRNTIDVSGIDGSFGLGAMFEVVENQLWMGASYQSRPNLTGSMKLNGNLTLSYQKDVAVTPITFTHALPDIIRLGVRYRPWKTLELRLFGDYTRWSVMKCQCVAMRDKPCTVTPTGADATPGLTTIQYIDRNWNDTVAIRMGATYQVVPGFEVLAGAGFETAATPKATLEPGLPDSRNIRAALGGRVTLSSTMAVSVGFTGVHYLPRNSTGLSILSDSDVPARRADGGGFYELWLGLLNASLEKQF